MVADATKRKEEDIPKRKEADYLFRYDCFFISVRAQDEDQAKSKVLKGEVLGITIDAERIDGAKLKLIKKGGE